MDRRSSTGTFQVPRKSSHDEGLYVINEHERVLALCAYIPVVCLVSYLLDDDSNEFVHFHARRGTLLFLVTIASGSLFFLPEIGLYAGTTLLTLVTAASLLGLRSAATGRCQECSPRSSTSRTVRRSAV